LPNAWSVAPIPGACMPNIRAPISSVRLNTPSTDRSGDVTGRCT
jgi:hypothetical protein